MITPPRSATTLPAPRWNNPWNAKYGVGSFTVMDEGFTLYPTAKAQDAADRYNSLADAERAAAQITRDPAHQAVAVLGDNDSFGLYKLDAQRLPDVEQPNYQLPPRGKLVLSQIPHSDSIGSDTWSQVTSSNDALKAIAGSGRVIPVVAGNDPIRNGYLS